MFIEDKVGRNEDEEFKGLPLWKVMLLIAAAVVTICLMAGAIAIAILRL